MGKTNMMVLSKTEVSTSIQEVQWAYSVVILCLARHHLAYSITRLKAIKSSSFLFIIYISWHKNIILNMRYNSLFVARVMQLCICNVLQAVLISNSPETHKNICRINNLFILHKKEGRKGRREENLHWLLSLKCWRWRFEETWFSLWIFYKLSFCFQNNH